MNGAREFAALFQTGQIGRLYVVAGRHARGRTFRIFVLPEGEAARPNGSENAPLNSDAVEVYGVTGGNPGWTESYGWLHDGKWVNDFMALVVARTEAAERVEAERVARAVAFDQAAAERRHQLLAAY